MLKNIIIFFWIFIFGLLFLYSFTQVDLGLTLNRSSIITEVQKSFQYIGYFNRPLSAFLASSIFILLFTMYCLTLWFVVGKKITLKSVRLIVLFGSVILLFSYNAFSYDLFNYMFDAKIITEYGQNPYVKKALDFPSDPYLGFMHWTHRTYPYGPVWLGITVPLSYIGSQVFIVTYYIFKMLMVGAYLLCSLLVYKIAKKTKIVDPLFALTFFALNPLVIVEGLVSAHHDLVMMVLALGAVYLLIIQKNISSWIFFILSVGVKFATIVLTPLFLWYPFSKRKNKDEMLFMGGAIFMLVAVVLASYRTTFQPWYLLFVLPFVALISKKAFVFIPSVVISFLVLFQYIPFLYTGNFDLPVPLLMHEMLVVSVFCGVIFAIGFQILKKVHHEND